MTSEEKDEEQKFVETHDLGGRHILLVEDNKLNVLVAKKILNAMQANVDVAKDGAEGLRMHTAKKYDLILMDLHMPVMDGFEATRIIREKDKTTPIIAFSADAFADARRKAEEAGMNDFISKPFDPGMLFEKIRTNIEM
jgi:CheY-like chemotaxis protein